MSNREEVIEQLRKIVEQRGGKKTGMKSKLDKLGEIDEAYYNQYVNDGSIQYKKNRVAVIDMILEKIYGISGLNGAEKQKARGTVPESMINEAMEELKKVRAKEIKLQRENDKHALKAMEEIEDNDNIKRLQANLKELAPYKPLDDAGIKRLKRTQKLKNPELYEIEEVGVAGKPRGSILDTNDEAALKKLQMYFGKGLKQKRKPSEYNMFVKAYMKKHKGASLADAARAWKA